MPDSRPNTSYRLGRSDETVEWALRELESSLEGCTQEPRARAALDVLRSSVSRVVTSAATDPLTWLANRAWFTRMLDERLRPELASTGRAALLFLDLDGFKNVNDERGHPAGDQLLTEVGRRITHSVRDLDLVARHGGDEFVVLLENIENPAVAHTVAARVVEAISAPFEIEGTIVRLGVSIGVAYYPEHGKSGSELLKRADEAMYRAKGQGGRAYAVFGERAELSVPRAPNRSWTWELSPVRLESGAQDATQIVFKQRQ
jgi:diguanylate cyclase (GGDEF)-like protein